MRERPYLDWGGQDLVDYFYDNEDDFEIIIDVAYELMFRRVISQEIKSDVIECLVKFYNNRFEDIPPAPDYPFPTTHIFETRKKMRHQLDYPDWREVGLLKLSGYTVGMSGIPLQERKRILNYVFLEDDLSDIDDEEYAAEWGKAKTSDRLSKLSNTIAAFVRNAKRRPDKMDEAISDWEADLEYLKETFYEGWGDFPWPDLKVPDW